MIYAWTVNDQHALDKDNNKNYNNDDDDADDDADDDDDDDDDDGKQLLLRKIIFDYMFGKLTPGLPYPMTFSTTQNAIVKGAQYVLDIECFSRTGGTAREYCFTNYSISFFFLFPFIKFILSLEITFPEAHQ